MHYYAFPSQINQSLALQKRRIGLACDSNTAGQKGENQEVDFSSVCKKVLVESSTICLKLLASSISLLCA